MKKLHLTRLSVIILTLPVLLTVGCKKEVPIVLPTLTTSTVSNITTTDATCGGNVTTDGGAAVTARGVCWNTTQNPTLSMTKANNGSTVNGSGIGSFTSSITGLSPGTTYYVRAYATNSKGTAYGSQTQFTTTAVAPVLTTTAASAITSSSLTSGGNISSDGGSAITARGVCWGTTPNPTITGSKTTDGTGTGSFTSNITGLTPGTTYYVNAYATNSIGTSYGTQITVTTLAPSYPGTSLPAVKIAGIWWAPVNAGYDQTNLQYGLIHQWNRKYGQNYGTTNTVPGGVTLATGNDIANKDIFYLQNNTYADWTSTWMANWNLTDYNPCPSGWRVPTMAELTSLVNAGHTWVASGGPNNLPGRWFGGNHAGDRSGSGFFPAGGNISHLGSSQERGVSGSFWSSNTNLRMSFNSTEIYVSVMYQSGLVNNSYGMSIRCVQN